MAIAGNVVLESVVPSLRKEAVRITGSTRLAHVAASVASAQDRLTAWDDPKNTVASFRRLKGLIDPFGWRSPDPAVREEYLRRKDILRAIAKKAGIRKCRTEWDDLGGVSLDEDSPVIQPDFRLLPNDRTLDDYGPIVRSGSITGVASMTWVGAGTSRADDRVTLFDPGKKPTLAILTRMIEAHDLTGFLGDVDRWRETLTRIVEVAGVVGIDKARKVWEEVRRRKLREDDPRFWMTAWDDRWVEGTIEVPEESVA